MGFKLLVLVLVLASRTVVFFFSIAIKKKGALWPTRATWFTRRLRAGTSGIREMVPGPRRHSVCLWGTVRTQESEVTKCRWSGVRRREGDGRRGRRG
ncbi:hypothetical protein QBC39DRAFT_350648 [Podospora conica]|nr:hypothetical protein QBC39DRAFT_350648 [Schizothecium conicum]